MIQIGDIKIHLINDGSHKVDPGGAFGLIPRVMWSRYFTPDENHLIPMTLTCLLVQVEGRNIVIDTGYGSKVPEKQLDYMQMSRPNGGLVEGLARLGVDPNDVSLVIDTHLHGDHCGGNTAYDADGKIVPVFPFADYVVQRREYEDASQPNERTRATYIAENFQPLLDSGQMRLLDGETDFGSGLTGIVTPGHTPGHMSVRFESKGEHGAFLCDMASYAVHFERLAWMTAYDVEPLVTLETKRVWQRWALENNAILIFPHDKFRPAGRLIEGENGKHQLESLDEPFA